MSIGSPRATLISSTKIFAGWLHFPTGVQVQRWSRESGADGPPAAVGGGTAGLARTFGPAWAISILIFSLLLSSQAQGNPLTPHECAEMLKDGGGLSWRCWPYEEEQLRDEQQLRAVIKKWEVEQEIKKLPDNHPRKCALRLQKNGRLGYVKCKKYRGREKQLLNKKQLQALITQWELEQEAKQAFEREEREAGKLPSDHPRRCAVNLQKWDYLGHGCKRYEGAEAQLRDKQQLQALTVWWEDIQKAKQKVERLPGDHPRKCAVHLQEWDGLSGHCARYRGFEDRLRDEQQLQALTEWWQGEQQKIKAAREAKQAEKKAAIERYCAQNPDLCIIYGIK